MSNGNGEARGRDLFGIDRGHFDDEERPFPKPDERSDEDLPDVASKPAKNIVDFVKNQQGLTDDQKRGLNRLASAIDQLNTRVGNISAGFQPPVYKSKNYPDATHYWPMDDGGEDLIGDATLTEQNNPARTTGLRGTGAYDFQGNQGFLHGTVPAESINGSVTFSSWIVWPENSSSSGPLTFIVDDSGGGPQPVAGIVAAEVNNELYPRFQIELDGGTQFVDASETMSDTDVIESNDVRIEPGRLLHVAGSWDGSELSLYVNGVLVTRKSFSDSFSYNVDGSIFVGGSSIFSTYPGVPVMDEAMILDRESSWDEAARMYTRRFAPAETLYEPSYDPSNFSDVLHYFPLNEDSPAGIKNYGSSDQTIEWATETPVLDKDFGDQSSGIIINSKDNEGVVSDNLGNFDPANFSVATLVNVGALGGNGAIINTATPFTGTPENAAPDSGYFVTVNNQGYVYAWLVVDGLNNPVHLASNNAIHDGQWHSVVLRFDGTTTELVVDGTRVDSTTLEQSTSVTLDGDEWLAVAGGVDSANVAVSDLMVANTASFEYDQYHANMPAMNPAGGIFPLLLDASLNSTTPSENSVAIDGEVNEVSGTELSDTDTVELVAEVLDFDTTTVVGEDRTTVDPANPPSTNTLTVDQLNASTNYDARVGLDINGTSEYRTNTVNFTTTSSYLYSETQLESSGGDTALYTPFDATDPANFEILYDFTGASITMDGQDFDATVDTSIINGTTGIALEGAAHPEVNGLSEAFSSVDQVVFGMWVNVNSVEATDSPLFRLYNPEDNSLVASAYLAGSQGEGVVEFNVVDADATTRTVTTGAGFYTGGEWTHFGFGYNPEDMFVTSYPVNETRNEAHNGHAGGSLIVSKAAMKLDIGADDSTVANNYHMDEFAGIVGISEPPQIEDVFYPPADA